MQRLQLIMLLLGSFLVIQCTPKLHTWFLKDADIQNVVENKNLLQYAPDPCYDILSYIPDTAHLSHTPIKYVRVNFHWMNVRDSSLNYNGQQAINFTRNLLAAMNHNLENNQKMWLPQGNNTSVLPIRLRLLLTPITNDPKDNGIYFHYDNDLALYIHKGKYANLYKMEPIEKYHIRSDSVLNIFIMPHHPDSTKSKTYISSGVAVALGDAVKAAGMFETKAPADNFAGMMNHEIAHIFGLNHAWNGDECTDTPDHPNGCWLRTTESPCDTLASNNLMDYNAYQNAWTPCQIGKLHYWMAQENYPARRFLQPNWCQLHKDRPVVIRDSVEWHGAKDLEGDLTITQAGILTINCRVSIPANAKITVQPGGTLILNNARLHNACGDLWQGIEIQQLGKLKGQVIFMGAPKLENVMDTSFIHKK